MRIEEASQSSNPRSLGFGTYVFSVQLLPIPLNPPKAQRAWLRVKKGETLAKRKIRQSPFFKGAATAGNPKDHAKQILWHCQIPTQKGLVLGIVPKLNNGLIVPSEALQFEDTVKTINAIALLHYSKLDSEGTIVSSNCCPRRSRVRGDRMPI